MRSAWAKWTLPAVLGLAVLGLALWTLSSKAPPASAAASAPSRPRAARTPFPKASTRRAALSSPAVPPLAQTPPEDGAPAFHEAAPGRFRASGANFRARVSAADGVTVRNTRPAAFGAGAKEERSLNVKLQQVSRGAVSIYDRAEDPAPGGAYLRHAADQSLRLHRAAGLAERYRALPNGVEVFYDLSEEPAGEGDLVFLEKMALKGLRPMAPPGRSGGLFFADARGGWALQVGRVVARDARGRSVTAEPEIEPGRDAIRFVIPGAWLSQAAYPVAVDPPIVVPQFTISELGGLTGAPMLAGGGAQFAQAHIDFIGGFNNPIMVAKVVGSGGTLSPEIQVTFLPERPLSTTSQRNQIASDGTDFLVVWSEFSGGLFGAIIDGATKQLKDLGGGNTKFFIAATTARLSNELPLVAYNGNQYVVAWHDRVGTGVGLFFALVNTDGSGVSTAKPLGVLPGIPLNQFLFSVTPGPSNQTLFLYRETRTRYARRQAHTRAQRIDVNGNLLDPEGVHLFNERFVDGGFGVPIGAAFDGTSGWQILSAQNQAQDSNIFLHLLSDTGQVTRADQLNPPNGVFTTMGVGPAGLNSEDTFSLAFAANGVNLPPPGGGVGGEWLFVRNHKISNTEFHLLAKRVDAATGTEYDVTPFQVDNGNVSVRRNAVAAAAPGLSQFLVAWNDGGTINGGLGDTIEGALIDTAGAVDNSDFLEAVLTSSSPGGDPVVIPPNTSVTFDWSTSKGTITAQTLFFGDGAFVKPAVGTTQATHLYKRIGRRQARLTLKRGTYTHSDTLTVIVGQGQGGEGAEAVLGDPAPITNSANLNSAFLVNKAKFNLDFVNPNKDSLTIEGFLSRRFLPDTVINESLAGKAVTVTLDAPANPVINDSFDNAGAPVVIPPFFMDHGGDYVDPENTSPNKVRWNFKEKTAFFQLTISNGSLASLVPDLGAHQARDRRLLLGLDIDGQNYGTVTVVTLYTSTLFSGAGNYVLLGAGKEDSGSLDIKRVVAREVGKDPAFSHTVRVTGRLIKPGGLSAPDGALFTLPASGTGTWQFALGDFLSAPIDLSTANVTQNNKIIIYRAPKGTSGDVTLFRLNRANGAFVLLAKKIPTPGGVGGVGLPLAGLSALGNPFHLITQVEFFAGMSLDLDVGNVSAGGYQRVFRRHARVRAWRQR